jgi:intracellular septation protein
MASINEFVWRNFSDSAWVNFKVFGAMPITVLFFALQIPFILRHQTNNNN